MFIEFTNPRGNPVMLRPETVVAIQGYRAVRQPTGEEVDRCYVLLANRETVGVAAHADVVRSAVEAARRVTDAPGQTDFLTGAADVQKHGVLTGFQSDSLNDPPVGSAANR